MRFPTQNAFKYCLCLVFEAPASPLALLLSLELVCVPLAPAVGEGGALRRVAVEIPVNVLLLAGAYLKGNEIYYMESNAPAHPIFVLAKRRIEDACLKKSRQQPNIHPSLPRRPERYRLMWEKK